MEEKMSEMKLETWNETGKNWDYVDVAIDGEPVRFIGPKRVANLLAASRAKTLAEVKEAIKDHHWTECRETVLMVHFHNLFMKLEGGSDFQSAPLLEN